MDDHKTGGNRVDATNSVFSDLYGEIKSLPVIVESVSFEGKRIETERQTFERTIIRVRGDDATGFGEDVTRPIEAHEQLREDGLPLPTGDWTIETFSDALDTDPVRLERTVPRETPEHLRWAIESAALDLALKQAGRTLATVLDRVYEPMAFVVSPRLGDPPRTRPVDRFLDTNPNIEFKIDVPDTPSDELLSTLAGTGAIRVLDLKAQYDSDVGAPADSNLYRRLFEIFPNALIEDPAVTDATRPVLEEYSDRISWDAPITSVESIKNLPWEPTVLNIKPCRSGSLESLCRILEYAFQHDIELYGGGMFELDAGRAHSQAIASLFYPNSPNDLAPPVYHQYQADKSYPSSPLDPPAKLTGIGWY
jgi:L-alanine-DL-glutamate epimerase-like enolase superfamily enzyme